ncbi:type III secretion system protein, YseE family [Chromobacterium piscinae]|nr:type III secretion system protein, YseE family [Chromobacterium piscinae]
MHTLTELEDRLAADASGHQRRALLDALNETVMALGRAQREPQSAERYASLERQRLAALAAMRVVDTVWSRLHS